MLLSVLHLAQTVGMDNLEAFYDSQLVATQFYREYEAREERMIAYMKAAQELASKFVIFQLPKVSRGENTIADALVSLASTSNPNLRLIISVEYIEQPRIKVDPGKKGGQVISTRAVHLTKMSSEKTLTTHTMVKSWEERTGENQSNFSSEMVGKEDF